MYLRDCLIENVGPLESVDLSLPFNENGTPRPVVLVGRNGAGKSILLSHVVDALIEFAKTAFRDILVGQRGTESPFFKIVGGTNQRIGAEYGIALLTFSDEETTHWYVDKSGTLDPANCAVGMGARFPGAGSWPKEGNHKRTSMASEYAQRFFKASAICYFPANRHERPHWINPNAVTDNPIYYFAENYTDHLYKPVIVESATRETKQWLLDVMLDSRVEVEPYSETMPDGGPQVRLRLTGNIGDHFLLRQSRVNVEAVLKAILQDEGARLEYGYRTVSSYRLSIALSDGVVIPSLDHLSSGQASLFNLFSTIIRYADRVDINKSIHLGDIGGIVLVDEIEAQAHSDLQYEVLPKLIKLFPKVQFILTSHSPLFLLGMEKEFGSEGFAVIEMPTGNTITTERFSEFLRSWEYYRDTTANEQSIEGVLRASHRPLVLTEGETDERFIKTALELFGRGDLLNAVDIEWVGKPGPKGAESAGKDALNNVQKVLAANPNLTARRVLFLYDCDVSKPNFDSPAMSVRSIPKNEENVRVENGIENLFAETLFDDRFYSSKTRKGLDGGSVVTTRLDKKGFCSWVCDERRRVEDFTKFDAVIDFVQTFLKGPTDDPGEAVLLSEATSTVGAEAIQNGARTEAPAPSSPSSVIAPG